MITALARSSNGSSELIAARLSLVTPPAIEPLTIAEAKRQIKVDSSAGEPSPSVITVALASPAIAGNVTAGAHRYRSTFVTADGETDGGDISAIVTVADAAVNGKVELTAIPLGGSAVTSRKLYRTTAGGATFLLLATLSDNTTTVYTDNVADGSLGAAAPSTNTTADPELRDWITSSRLLCESDPSADGTSGGTGRALITQTYDLKLDGFPWGSASEVSALWFPTYYERQYLGGSGMRPILIPKPPLISVTSITYVDTDGTTQTWSSSLYTVDAPAGEFAEPGRIYPNYGQVYPVTRAQPAAVTIRFVCGYGAAASSVPGPIKSAMKLLIGVWDANRAAGVVERASSDVIPFGVDALLQPYRVM